MLHLLTKPLTRFLLALGLASTLCASDLGGPETITLHINCDQGIVDARHKIEISLTGPDGKNLGPFTAYVEESGSTEGAALSLETVLENNGISDVKTSDSPSDPKQEENVTMPDGYSVSKVTVYKQGSDGTWNAADGHLQVNNSEGKKISNQ
jgi:hypothetical protein